MTGTQACDCSFSASHSARAWASPLAGACSRYSCPPPVLATSTWGTGRYPATAIAQAVLEQRRIEVRDETPDKTWVLNMDDTIAAQ